METLEYGHIRIKAYTLEKVVKSIAQLKCIYTNAHSIGNNQEELEATVEWENCDTLAITET